MKLNKFVFSVFLLLFNHFVIISTSTNFADHEEQILMEEDLLLVKNNEPRIFNNKNKRVFQAETTMEMGSGSPDITTATTYSTAFFNTTLLTTLSDFTSSEPTFSFDTTGETTEESSTSDSMNETTTYSFTTQEANSSQSTELIDLTTINSLTSVETTTNYSSIDFTTSNFSFDTTQESSTSNSTSESTTINSLTSIETSTITSSNYSSIDYTTSVSTFSIDTTQESSTSNSTTKNSSTSIEASTITSFNYSSLEATTILLTSETFTSTQQTSARLIVTTESTTNKTDSTTNSSSTTTTTTVTTTGLSGLLVGNSDVSLVSSWNNIQDYNSYFVFLQDNQLPINLLGQSFNSFAIHPNGYVSLGSSNFISQFPSAAINSYKIPIISPFWFSSYFGTDSDITYGRYDSTNMDTALQTSVQNLINARLESRVVPKARQVRAINRNLVPSLDTIYIITWKNLHFYSNVSDQTATFQLILATTVTDQKTYALFKYPQNGLKWSSNDINVFIGYISNSKDYENVVNLYSNIKNKRIVPSAIYDKIGNTNILGLFVYDLRYGQLLDACTDWYQKELVKNSKVKKLNNNLECPALAVAALLHPLFSQYKGKTWQTDSICFTLKTNIFQNKKQQQFCCYDFTNFLYSGTLLTQGFRAGFSYNSKNLIDLIGNGTICCQDNNSDLCNKYYSLYPQPSISRKQTNRFANGLGDSQLNTFDGLSYSFNGLGRFLLTKAVDNSFEIQSETKVFTNVNNPSISGILYKAFAFKTIDSMTFEVRLNELNNNLPFLEIYVNRATQPLQIDNPIGYYTEFNCLTDSSSTCNSLLLTDNKNMQIMFSNGLSIVFQVITVPVKQFQSSSWISFTISIINPTIDYKNNLIGLLGNNNDESSDDIRSRTGDKPANNKENSKYNTLVTWALTSSDSDLFIKTSTRRETRQAVAGYTPTYIENIVANDPTLANQVNESCSYVIACVTSVLLSGVAAIGDQSKRAQLQFQVALDTLALNPPSISFQNKTINVDWSLKSPINIIADVFSYDKNIINSNSIEIIVTNAKSWTSSKTSSNSSHIVVSIIYTPTPGEYPTFQITVKDSKNLTTTNSLPEILICDCKSLDTANQCLYSNVQISINPYVRLVACKCDSYYSGSFCNNTIQYCTLGDWCTLYSAFNTNIQCVSYNVSMQKSTGLKYYCDGTCSAGFTKNANGACEDNDECVLKTSNCPAEAKCVNQIGTFTCTCPTGFIYKSSTNNCQLIDFCSTSLNTCDSICSSTPIGVNCSCYYGYQLNSTTNKCDSSFKIPECNPLNCSEICTKNITTNIAQCFCNIGFSSAPLLDNKVCYDVNECLNKNGGCSKYCNNTIGSYKCSCDKGYTLDVDLQTCIECPYGQYGDNCQETCECSNSISCDNVKGCICTPEYTGINCDVAIDLCLNLNITFNATTTKCESFIGYYQLNCLAGYEKTISSNGICQKINYCAVDKCPASSTCRSLETTFDCKCSLGYEYNSTLNSCLDQNECKLSTAKCPGNSTCQNTVGSYDCICLSGFYDSNVNKTNQNPLCVDIDECTFPVCGANQTCTNTIGSYKCSCQNGLILIDGLCVVSSFTTTTQPTTIAVGLILSIVLPIGIVLILSVLAALVCYFWFKMRAENLSKQNLKKIDQTKLKANLDNLGPKWPLEKSMFQREDYNDDDLDSNYLNNFQEDYNDVLNGNQAGIHSIYRSNYFVDDTNKSDVDFFKSLEDKASSSQHTTIIRPQSIFSESSISLPTAYYEHTTPYLKSSFPQFNGNQLDEFPEEDESNEIFDNNNLDYDDDLNSRNNNFEDLFDNDNQNDDFVEAFNPNVKIPRPKLQFNPMNLFKFGPKPGESTE